MAYLRVINNGWTLFKTIQLINKKTWQQRTMTQASKMDAIKKKALQNFRYSIKRVLISSPILMP